VTAAPEVRDAIVVGLVRMGLMHNAALLVGGGAPDHAAGGVRDFVKAERPHTGEEKATDISYDVVVRHDVMGTAVLSLSPEALPQKRTASIHFEEGDMDVEETVTRIDLDQPVDDAVFSLGPGSPPMPAPMPAPAPATTTTTTTTATTTPVLDDFAAARFTAVSSDVVKSDVPHGDTAPLCFPDGAISELDDVQRLMGGVGWDDAANSHARAATFPDGISLLPNPASRIVRVSAQDVPDGAAIVVRPTALRAYTVFQATPTVSVGVAFVLDKAGRVVSVYESYAPENGSFVRRPDAPTPPMRMLALHWSAADRIDEVTTIDQLCRRVVYRPATPPP
jgi:hypothetical protein